MTRRALLKVMAYGPILSMGERAAYARSFFGQGGHYRVRYVYKAVAMSSVQLTEKKLSFEALDIIEKINSEFINRGELLDFKERSSERALTYDYVFISKEAHDQWQTMMQKNKALNLSSVPIRIFVQNFSAKKFQFGKRIDRQVTFEIV